MTILKRGEDLNKALGFNLFNDSSDEEESKNSNNDIEMSRKIQKVKQFVMETEEPE
jgi:hypothetical protein